MQIPRIEAQESLAVNFVRVASTVCANELPDFNPSATPWSWSPENAAAFAAPLKVERRRTINEHSGLRVVTLDIGGEDEENMLVQESDDRALADDPYAASFLERFRDIYAVHSHELCLQVLRKQLGVEVSDEAGSNGAGFRIIDKRVGRNAVIQPGA
jgi:hypothetical protein